MQLVAADQRQFLKSKESVIFKSNNGNYTTKYSLQKGQIIKLVSEGYMDIDSTQEKFAHFDMLLNILCMNGIPPPYYLQINYSQVNGADKLSRDYFKKRIDQLFGDGVVAAAAVISPSFFIRTIGTLYRKINPKLNYRFFRNEFEAGEFLHQVNHITSFKTPEDCLASQEEEGYFLFAGQKVKFFRKKEWQYAEGDIKVNIVLLDNQCVIMQYIGKPNLRQIQANIATSLKITESIINQKLDMILDVSAMDMPNLKVKKYAAEIISQTKNLWSCRYIVTPPRLKTIYQIIKIFLPRSLENARAVSSLTEALQLCQKQQVFKKTTESGLSEKAGLMQLSKAELADKVRKLEMGQMRANNTLFKTLSRITWDSSFAPAYLSIPPEEDPFFDLFNCVNILQDDIYCMITELKEFNRNLEQQVKERTLQLNQQNEELLKLNAEMDNFVYSVSHDLKAPLASILGLVTLNQKEQDPQKNAEYNALIRKSLLKLNGFITDLLQLSRNSRTALVKQAIDFNQLIHGTIDELKYMENAELIEMAIKIESDAVFYNDEKRIAMVLKNLVSNAIKYSLVTYKDAKINISVEINGVACKITISDNGMGIAPEHQDRIFDMFYRGTERSTGTGIGLHIVKEVVDKLNGRISFTSEFGQGSTFTVTIPNLQLDN